MQGYILFDKDYNRLTRLYKFSSDKNAGWLFSAEEIRLIVDEIGIVPAYYQKCELVEEEDGDVNVYALEDMQPF